MNWSLDRTNFDRSIAVVIGINNYQNGINPLKTAVNDAIAIANLLEQKYEYQRVIRLFPDHNEATLPQLNQLLFETLPKEIKPTQGDRLLFYFAGHGIARNSEDGPAGAIIPQDGHSGKWETYLPMKKLNEALSQLECHHLLVVLDCCFAGNFRWSSHRNVIPELETIHREHYDRFIRYPAWQAITSAAHNQEALDYTDERGIAPDSLHSPFAKALINGLKDMKADSTGDGVITAPELYLHLRDSLIGKDGLSELQTAGLWPLQKHDRGEFIFTLPGFEPKKLKPAPKLNPKNNPYRGLESFDEEHSELFFGRTELVKKLQDFVKIHSLTVVLGASGSGKSSLVKAGLIPKLRKETTEEWYILPPIRPGKTPLQALNNGLKNAKFPELKPQNPQHNLAKSIEFWAKNHPHSKLLLLIDQSEEIITLCQKEDERKEFFQQILTAIDAHRDKLRVVLTLRSDFEPQIRDAAIEFIPEDYRLKNTELKNPWQSGRFIVSAMTRGELREVIEKPAEVRVMFFDPEELVEQLIDEVAYMPGALPLLSFALSELYLKYLERQRQAEIKGEILERTMIQSDYQDLGGVMQSLTKRADEEYHSLVNQNSAYRQVIRHVMLRMVALGGGELARRRVSLVELEYPPKKDDLVKKVIKCFTEARLLVTGKDGDRNSYVEPAHDALVRGWKKLLEWKQKDEEGLVLQRRLTPAAEEWKNQQQVKFLWHNNPRLDLLKKVSLSDDNWLNLLEAEFVQRSIRKKRSNTIVRWSIAGSVLLGAVIFSAAVWMQWRNSELNQANSLGRYSLSLFAQHKEMEALVEAIRAGKILQKHKARDPQVITALQKVLYEGRERNRLQGHDQFVRSISISPDGHILASSSDHNVVSKSSDNTIKLWNLETGEVIRTFQGHTEFVTSISISPDSQTLASSSFDNTIKLWNLETGELIRTLQGHDQPVTSISISPDSQTLASGSFDNTIKLWNLETGKEIRTFQGHDDSVDSVSISPDGQTLASGSNDNTIKLWNLETGKEIRTLQGHTEWVSSVSFNPDGQTLASGSNDNTIKLWNLETGEEIRTFQGHTGWVSSVSFSPDGQTLASGSFDNTIKLWNLETGEEIRTFQGHNDDVSSVSFSPDGQTLASGSRDQTIKLWDPTEEVIRTLQGHNDDVSSVSFSPDGQTLASSSDNTIKLWNLETGEIIRTLQGHDHSVFSISISPDGQTLASGSLDNTIKLWNLETGELIRTLQGHDNSVESVSISPDGQTLASGSRDQTIKLWNLETGEVIRTLQGHDDWVFSVSISPDGQTLASGGDDNTIKLWNLETGEVIRTLQGHPDVVLSVSISPDGQTLASGSYDYTIKLWNLETGEVIRTLQGHPNIVNSVSFSPDGQTLASGSDDKTIKLWNLETGEVIRTLQGHDGDVNSVSFSPDGQTLASGSRDQTIKLWSLDFNLDSLMVKSCDWARNYLESNPNVKESDRQLCDDFKTSQLPE
ncbi:caspase family protein [Okeania sp. SIO2B3]|uniref:nSTAND1 domain-containing NTPase n=1 Tax=Okeania sp. SIO2B3 TaxID=2607784 RepID=UPI0013C1C320|nr:caspase family protein [Okeania sp. SIO2B3]NET46389.1 hypothetical protein [Okeania sp. SIO2B3]